MKRAAFTLSETLIALVIIGVVAALTIPAISRSAEKYILNNQFKKAYSTILTAMNKADADLGGNAECYYHTDRTQGNFFSECQKFYEQMFKNLNVIKVCKGNAKRDGCIPDPYIKNYPTTTNLNGFWQEKIENTNLVYILNDGTMIISYGVWNAAIFMVDINGHKGPNTIGKDILIFLIESDGQNGKRIMPRYATTNIAKIYSES